MFAKVNIYLKIYDTRTLPSEDTFFLNPVFIW